MPAPTDHLSPRWFGVGLAVAMLLPWAAFAQTPAWPGPEDMARARNAHPFPTPAQLAAQPARPLPQIPTTLATKTTIDIAAMARQGGQLAAPTTNAATPGTLRIFITLDMPRGSLQRLFDQAARSGAVLVLRGLKAQSLRETLAVVSDLIDKRQVAWVIDPDAYTRYGVTSAPTFVLTLTDETAASGNTAAQGQINTNTAQSNVPGYTANPPQASYFGNPGISAPAAAAANACAGGPGNAAGFGAQACNAVNFSQTNPTLRPNFTIAPNDPLLAGGKTITADPQAIAGNIAGSYSDCTVQTSTQPDIFQTEICHQYRTMDTLSCDKVLIVTPIQTPGCSAGQFLTRVTANPCPACVDYLAYDFTCGANDYVMHVFTINKSTGCVYTDLGTLNVPGTLNAQIPKTPGPTQINGYYCYQTYYSQSCSGTNCSIGAWFSNPCQGTSYYGVSTFAMPTTVSFTDTWDDQCAALEARAQ